MENNKNSKNFKPTIVNLYNQLLMDIFSIYFRWLYTQNFMI